MINKKKFYGPILLASLLSLAQANADSCIFGIPNPEDQDACMCATGYTGDLCNKVSNAICFNGGYEFFNFSEEDWECQCVNEFVGENCGAIDHSIRRQQKGQKSLRNGGSLDADLSFDEPTPQTTTKAPWVPCGDFDCFNNGDLTYNTDCTEETDLNGSCDMNCTCTCDFGFRGENCHIEDPCENVSCNFPFGACNLGKCQCFPGWTGPNCEIFDAECSQTFCFNGGFCSGGDCSCPEEFIGEHCSVRNKCYEKDCGPHGICNNGECQCDECYTGELCQTYDKCCGVDCGFYGNCLEATGECDFCSAYAVGLGASHYFSFDGSRTDFYGQTCAYQLSGICQGVDFPEDLPRFRLIGNHNSDAVYSQLDGWTIEYQPAGSSDVIKVMLDLENETIPKIQVNNQTATSLLVNHFYSNQQILTSGQNSNTIFFGIENPLMASNPNMNFKMKLQWRDSRLMLHLNCAYKNLVCGIMGDFNENSADDWVLSDGESFLQPPELTDAFDLTFWNSTYEFASEYLTSTCPAKTKLWTQISSKNVDCDADKMALAKSSDYCGILDTEIFSDCQIDLENLRSVCVHDLCLVDETGWNSILCEILNFHSEKCADAGQILPNWKFPSLCPSTCDANLQNTVYSDNASSCLLTTENCQPINQEICNFPNESRCVCSDQFPYYDRFENKCKKFCPSVNCIGVRCGDGEICENGFCVIYVETTTKSVTTQEITTVVVSTESSTAASENETTTTTTNSDSQVTTRSTTKAPVVNPDVTTESNEKNTDSSDTTKNTTKISETETTVASENKVTTSGTDEDNQATTESVTLAPNSSSDDATTESVNTTLDTSMVFDNDTETTTNTSETTTTLAPENEITTIGVDENDQRTTNFVTDAPSSNSETTTKLAENTKAVTDSTENNNASDTTTRNSEIKNNQTTQETDNATSGVNTETTTQSTNSGSSQNSSTGTNVTTKFSDTTLADESTTRTTDTTNSENTQSATNSIETDFNATTQQNDLTSETTGNETNDVAATTENSTSIPDSSTSLIENTTQSVTNSTDEVT